MLNLSPKSEPKSEAEQSPSYPHLALSGFMPFAVCRLPFGVACEIKLS